MNGTAKSCISAYVEEYSSAVLFAGSSEFS